MPWRRKWQPTPVFLPGKSYGQRSLAGCSPWSHQQSDTAEHAHMHALTGKYTHYLVITCDELYLQNTESLYCTSETNTTLYINCVSVSNKINQRFSTQNKFLPWGIFDNVWRQLDLLQLGVLLVPSE